VHTGSWSVDRGVPADASIRELTYRSDSSSAARERSSETLAGRATPIPPMLLTAAPTVLPSPAPTPKGGYECSCVGLKEGSFDGGSVLKPCPPVESPGAYCGLCSGCNWEYSGPALAKGVREMCPGSVCYSAHPFPGQILHAEPTHKIAPTPALPSDLVRAAPPPPTPVVVASPTGSPVTLPTSPPSLRPTKAPTPKPCVDLKSQCKDWAR
jgi:hypothetical protein